MIDKTDRIDVDGTIAGGSTVETDDGSDVDDIFDALANVHRRRLLFELLHCTRQHVSTVTGVSRELAQADEELLRTHLAASRRVSEADEELLVKRHIHLPKLAEYGFVEWNRDDHVVTRGPRFGEVRPVLEFLNGQRDDRHLETIEIPLRR
ncbi:DUF7344 domain-containing protein [Natrinema ejinorense]|uniref:DUF7344 domain-containing protein n=1 Tax=Natrinema ejinorense TaxID=373386 RepID=UPI001FE44DF9|nr:hypothetical protein [Natrinema ejinorense]